MHHIRNESTITDVKIFQAIQSRATVYAILLWHISWWIIFYQITMVITISLISELEVFLKKLLIKQLKMMMNIHYYYFTCFWDSTFVAMQCRHIFKELQLSLNPPITKLPRLSADTIARVPYTTFGFPWIINLTSSYWHCNSKFCPTVYNYEISYQFFDIINERLQNRIHSISGDKSWLNKGYKIYTG